MADKAARGKNAQLSHMNTAQRNNYQKANSGRAIESAGVTGDQNHARAIAGTDANHILHQKKKSLHSDVNYGQNQGEAGQRSFLGQADGNNKLVKRYGLQTNQGNPSEMNEETYNPRNQKTPAVIVQDDVYSSDFLNAK